MQTMLREADQRFLNYLSGSLTIDKMELDTDFEKVEKLCEAVSNSVNSFSFNRKLLAEAILNNEDSKRLFLRVAFLWVELLASYKSKNYFDGRSECAVTICKLISEQNEFMEIFDEYMLFLPQDKEFYHSNIIKRSKQLQLLPEQIIVLYMGTSHRTLQQTFTSLVIKFLQSYKDEPLLIKMFQRLIKQDTLYEDLSFMPLI